MDKRYLPRKLFLFLLLAVLGDTIIVTSSRSNTGDDSRATASCPNGYDLTKCRIASGSKRDGTSVPKDLSHSCVARTGLNGNGVVVRCDIIKLQQADTAYLKDPISYLFVLYFKSKHFSQSQFILLCRYFSR